MGRKTIRWKIIVIPGMIVGLLIGLFIFSGLYNVCIMRTQLIQSDTDMLQIIRKNTDERLELITKVLVLTVVQDDYAEQLSVYRGRPDRNGEDQ